MSTKNRLADRFFLIMSSNQKSRQVSLYRLLQGLISDRKKKRIKKEELETRQICRQGRVPRQEPFLLKNLKQDLFTVLQPSFTFLSEIRPWKKPV
jgi:hypothetical protein